MLGEKQSSSCFCDSNKKYCFISEAFKADEIIIRAAVFNSTVSPWGKCRLLFYGMEAIVASCMNWEGNGMVHASRV